MGPYKIDVVVIGAGVIGLACAAKIAAHGRSVIVIEQGTRVGQGVTSRNSGVIHAGIYYPTGSLKAQLCIEGREQLYARAAARGIAHREFGKLIVASDMSELEQLSELETRARANGAREAHLIDARATTLLEPRVRALGALSSPRTGIIDVHALVESYRADALASGASLALATEVIALEARSAHELVATTRSSSGELATVCAEHVVNAAGLGASRVAALTGLPIEPLGYRQHLCKGDYFKLAAKHRGLASRLIYPLPARAGLGIHLTLDLDGALRAGPDTEYIETPSYHIDAGKRRVFGAALRRYLPDVADGDLEPDFAGIRPKLQAPGEAFRDFVIESAVLHGMPGLVNLLGIESPGITASPAIARRVASLVT